MSLERDLTQIRDLHPMLTQDLRTVSTGSQGPGSPDPTIPGGTDRVALAADIHDLLASWCTLVIDVRELHGGTAPTTTEGRADWLLAHAEWIAETLGVADVDAMHHLAVRLERTVAPTGRRRIPIGACPVDGCAGGAVWATLDLATGTPPDLTCDVDPSHTWDESRYRMLERMLVADEAPDRMKVAEWVLWAQTRCRPPTEWQVWRWVRVRPITIGWSPDDNTLDRIKTMEFWIEWKARRAA